MDQAWQLEQQAWKAMSQGTAADHYIRVMTSDALIVLPGRVIERDAILMSWEDAPRWDDYELSEPRLMPLDGQTVIVTYEARARRTGRDPFHAQLTSIYVWVGGAWALAFHQQTPAEPADRDDPEGRIGRSEPIESGRPNRV